MLITQVTLLALLGWGVVTAASAPAEHAPPVADTLQYLERLENLGFSGVVLVARDGRPLLARGYGLADRERDLPWTPATVSTVGSITKQFTGAAILLLQEEGRLNVSDPIAKYFDGVPDDKRPVTLHHLLTHSSGIVDLADADDWDPIGREEFVRRALEQELAFAPGEGYRYSNAGYSLLGAVIEQLSGGSWESFLRERLWVPYGLYETGYVLPEWGETRLAQGYREKERWGTVLERPFAEDGPYWVLRANGGVHSTAYDMLRWAEALRRGRVLSAESMQAYWKPHVSEGGDSHYGYGWVIVQVPELGQVITHNGGNGIHFADLAIVPALELVIFLQCNVVAHMPVAGALLEQMVRHFAAGSPYPRVPEVVPADADETAGLAGSYRFEEGGRLEVRADGGDLLVLPEDPATFSRLHSSAPLRWERIERFNRSIDEIAAALVQGDVRPLHAAYDGRVTVEYLEERRRQRRNDMEARFGPLRSHEIVGTALQGNRDVTVVRFLLERGSVLRAYVWDGQSEDELLGVSLAGLDPELRFRPVGEQRFESWDQRRGTVRSLSFETEADGKTRLLVGTEPDRLIATRE